MLGRLIGCRILRAVHVRHVAFCFFWVSVGTLSVLFQPAPPQKNKNSTSPPSPCALRVHGRYEYTNLAHTQPATVAALMKKLAAHAASPDQVPPTLFPERAPKVAAPGIAPGYYQCPQCTQGNAVCDTKSTAPEDCHLDPWCDDVKCVPSDDLSQ